MKLMQKQGLGLNLFLFATPVVTSLTVAISPTPAATVAGAVAIGGIGHISQEPIAIKTDVNTETFTGSQSGQVSSLALGYSAYGDLPFYPDDDTDPIGFTAAAGGVIGQGDKYLGVAQSTATLVTSFLVGAKQTFSFDFKVFSGLLANTSNPVQETAAAASFFSFQLVDACRNLILDTFNLFGQIDSTGNFLFVGQASKNFSPTLLGAGVFPVGDQLIAGALFSGSYARTFDQATHLQLKQISAVEAFAAADAEAVPEPATILGSTLFLGILGWGRRLKSQFSAVKVKVTDPSH